MSDDPPYNDNRWDPFAKFDATWSRMRLSDRLQVATLIVITIGTSAAIWNLKYLGDSLDLAKDATEAAKLSADAAKLAAIAAQDSAMAGRQQAEAAVAQAGAAVRSNELAEAGQREAAAACREDLRARLTFSVIVDQEPSEQAPSIRFLMPLVMAGKTEATRARVATNFTVAKAGAPVRLEDNKWDNSQWQNIGVVSVGEKTREIRAFSMLSKSTAAAYVKGDEDIVAFFRLEYCDAFQRRHHETRCARRSSTMISRIVTYCGVDTDRNDGDQPHPDCR